MSKKVSVICNIYHPNQGCFKRFLDACLSQTLSDVEFIFTLDSPTDIESRSTLKEYQSKFEASKNTFIFIENEKNLGIDACYINALDKTTGKYVFNPDDDDFFDNELLEKAYNYLEEQKVECVKIHVICGYINNTLLYEMERDTQTFIYTREYAFRNLDILASCFGTFYKLECIDLPVEFGVFYYYVRNDEGTALRTESGNLDNWDLSNNDKQTAEKDHKRYYCEMYKDQGITQDMSLSEMHEILYNCKDIMVYNKGLSYEFLKGL